MIAGKLTADYHHHKIVVVAYEGLNPPGRAAENPSGPCYTLSANRYAPEKSFKMFREKQLKSNDHKYFQT